MSNMRFHPVDYQLVLDDVFRMTERESAGFRGKLEKAVA